MVDIMQELPSLAERGARWFVRRRVGGEGDIEALVSGARAGAPDAIIDEVATKAARKAAIRAFLTSTFGGPYTAIPLALIDLQGSTAAEAKIAATAAYVRDPELFRREDWDREILFALLDHQPEGSRGRAFTASLAKRLLLGRVKKVAVRVASNTIPVVGGVAGGVIEYVYLQRRKATFKDRFAARSSSGADRTLVDESEHLAAADMPAR